MLLLLQKHLCIEVNKNLQVTEATQHNIASKSVEAVVAVHGHAEGSCQADGCSCDMAQQSVWHQKSRICDKHMSGTFLKQGKAQQFCQQCGRSHNPDAFDQGRKSCRTQLAKHAARLAHLHLLDLSLGPISAAVSSGACLPSHEHNANSHALMTLALRRTSTGGGEPLLFCLHSHSSPPSPSPSDAIPHTHAHTHMQ